MSRGWEGGLAPALCSNLVPTWVNQELVIASPSLSSRSAGLAFFLRMAAEIRVIINPIGKGSVKVIAALINGLFNIVVRVFISCSFAFITSVLAPEAIALSIAYFVYFSAKSGMSLK